MISVYKLEPTKNNNNKIEKQHIGTRKLERYPEKRIRLHLSVSFSMMRKNMKYDTTNSMLGSMKSRKPLKRTSKW